MTNNQIDQLDEIAATAMQIMAMTTDKRLVGMASYIFDKTVEIVKQDQMTDKKAFLLKVQCPPKSGRTITGE